MQNTSINFKRQVTIKLADVKLQGALSRLQSRFVEGRSAVISEIADLQETRTAAAAIRDRVLNDLEHWLLQFEQQATARGAVRALGGDWRGREPHRRRDRCAAWRTHGGQIQVHGQ